MTDTSPKKMTEEELLNAIAAEESSLDDGSASQISRQREQAQKYYQGDKFGNERPDYSQYVSRDVMETVEWIMPTMVDVFFSGQEVVKFEPRGPEDVQAAQQESDYLNYIWTQRNEGFRIGYQWIKDGLLQKNGVVKVWWDASIQKTKKKYPELTEDELDLLLLDDDVEVLEAFINEEGVISATVLEDVDNGRVKIENIPPEEFGIASGAKTIQEANYCRHKTFKTISELRAQGFDVSQLEMASSGGESINSSPEKYARHKDDNTNPAVPTQTNDPQREEVEVTESYIRVDADGDGFTELRKVIHVGKTILANDEVDIMPFAGWTPIIMSHKYYGMSVADTIMDIQDLRSQLVRNMLDNQYLLNNGRYEVVDEMVNVDDLLDSKPGGIVRVMAAGSVRQLDTPQLGASAFQMLEFVDNEREKRTGISGRTQGLDDNMLNSHTTATAAQLAMTAATKKIELIARVFAETGMKDLFMIMHKLVLSHQTNGDIFRLTNQFVPVDPQEWEERKDMVAVVGLGNGNPQEKWAEMARIGEILQAVGSTAAGARLISEQQVFNYVDDTVKLMDRSAAGRYIMNPADMPPPPPPEPTIEEKQLALEAEAEKGKAAAKSRELDLEQQKVMLKDREVKVDEFEAQTKREVAVAEIALEAEQERPVGIGD